MSSCNDLKRLHCWHDSMEVLAVNPPIQMQICCHCGEKRQKPTPNDTYHHEHGPFKPYNFTRYG